MKKTKEKIQIKTIDDYLSGIPEDFRTALEKLRKIIKETAPKAEEVISYQVPSFKYKGMLVGFAAFKNHCSFFVMGTAVMKLFNEELKKYETATATIHFTPDKPIPAAFVRKLVKARIKENELRVKNRKK